MKFLNRIFIINWIFFFLCIFVYKIIAISTRSTMSCNHVKTNKCISNNLGFIIDMHLLVFREL